MIEVSGSYANGFAPRDGQPLYPELWRGCVGAWAPCLGPTGLTLRDWSGRGNHGTLVGMSVATDWATNGGRYELTFDRTNKHVLFDRVISKPTGPGSMSCWFRPIANSYSALIMQNTTLGNNGIYQVSGTSIDVYPYGLTGGSFTAGKWTHMSVTWDGTTARLYINGVQAVTSAANPLFDVSNIGYEPNESANGGIDDVLLHSVCLSPRSVKLLASRRGIAYELAPRRRSLVQVAGFNRRRRLLVGAGS